MSARPETVAALDSPTRPSPEEVAEARMVIVDLLGMRGSETLPVLTEAVTQAYEVPAGRPLPGADGGEVDPDDPAVGHVRLARAARVALDELVDAGEVRGLPAEPGDEELAPDERDELAGVVDALAPAPDGGRFALREG